MKRITAGRSNDCDIVIFDETDNVSRHHLVISFNLLGKMRISDTSSNGTFINGTRMLKGVSIPVTRNDKVRLGRSIDLDWNQVKDPYKGMRLILLLLTAVVVVGGVLFGWYVWQKERQSQLGSPKIELIRTEIKSEGNWNQDSTNKVAPVVTSIDVSDKKTTKSPTDNRKKTESNGFNSKKKETSKSSKKTVPATSNELAVDSVAVL